MTKSPVASQFSVSGYVAEDDETAKAPRAHSENGEFYVRLTRFYAHYNPDNLSRVTQYLTQYKGNEELLFAILVKKYGPEPTRETSCAIAEPRQGARETSPAHTVTPLSSSDASSTIGSSNSSVAHYSRKRVHFPKVVSARDGNTDCETPYWAGGPTLISERDLLWLLKTGQTSNVELQKCFMGLLPQHPSSSWNGMTYTTHADNIALADQLFLGHTWAATLDSAKQMVHHGERFSRTTLYCTEACQSAGQHERWRLSVYYGQSNTLALLRTVWDPVVVPEPLPLTYSHISERDFLLSSDAPLSHATATTMSGLAAHQPQQPSLAQSVARLTVAVQELTTRLNTRLESLERRIAHLEQHMS